MINATSVLVCFLTGSVVAASLMNVLGLPGPVLPLVLLACILAAAWALRGMARSWRQPSLEMHERALIAFALVVGLLRLGPYAWQYVSGTLVAPVTWDDNWHFQELASLVNAEHWPPRLNFQPEAHFHFYYVPWLPAAAISSILLTLTGAPMIKLGYALGALLLDLAIAWSLIVIVRHFCPGPGRLAALVALLVAGAAVDGIFALRNLAAGQPSHSEWWQQGLLVHNSFSALSSALIWVPHHLIAGMAMLLAAVVATRPGTLEPHEEQGPYAVAGVLLAAAAFSSVFAFAGGLIALSPLIWELLRVRHRHRLAVLAVSALLPALPLAYIYLGADARGGFLLGHAYWGWHSRTGSSVMGGVGIVLAFMMMVLEVGWLYVIGRGLDRDEPDGHRLRNISIAAAVLLVSTAVIAFSGSNNWALRAPIVPVVVLACYVGRGFAEATSAARARPHAAGLLDPGIVARAGTLALYLGAIAHINELAVLAGASARSPAFAHETAACKSTIIEANRAPRAPGMPHGLATCQDEHSAYHVERRFVKPSLSHMDRELMGRGFGFLQSPARAAKPSLRADGSE